MLDFLTKCHPPFQIYLYSIVKIKIYIHILKIVVNVYLSDDRKKKKPLYKTKRIVLNIYICLAFVLVIYLIRTSHDENISVSCRDKYTDGIFFC